MAWLIAAESGSNLATRAALLRNPRCRSTDHRDAVQWVVWLAVGPGDLSKMALAGGRMVNGAEAAFPDEVV
jgi:hypothetical protein